MVYGLSDVFVDLVNILTINVHIVATVVWRRNRHEMIHKKTRV
jgi:hypothetical protein